MSAARPLPDEERTCRECQRSLPLASSFGHNGASADGWEAVCRDCVREHAERAKQVRRAAPTNTAILRPVADAWDIQKAVERTIHQRAQRMQEILAEAKPLHPISQDRRAELRQLQEEQDAAWETLRRLRAEWKLAVIAEQRPEQLAQYKTPVRWQRRAR